MAITNNNVKNIQFLRNGTALGTRQLAINALEAQKANVADGSIILARYSGAAADDVKTLAGLVYVNGNTRTVTIIDVEGASDNVETLRQEINAKLGNGVGSGTGESVTEQLAALSGTVGAASAETSVAGAKAYAKDYTDGQISGLDYSGVTTGDGVVVTNVTEADGKVAATAANVGGLKLTGYEQGSASGAVASTDTINEAFGKVENQIAAINSVVDDLDYTDTAVTGNYVSEVNEANGVISVTRVALPSINAISEAGKPITAVSESLGEISATAGTINAEYVNVTGNTFSSTTVQAALEEIDAAYKAADAAIVGDATDSGDTLGKLEDRIDALDADAKEYHIVKTTTGLSETVKERYSLVDADGNVSGDTIDIPKDSHIVSITYDGTTQKLTYNYIDASGNTQSTDVDMSELVLETEFGSGVTVTDHVAHGVVDPTSEKDSNNDSFLTVGADGFKVDGIKDEIDAKIGGLDVTGDTAVAGQYVAAIEETDGLVAVKSRANVSEAVLNNYSKGSDATAVASTDTVNQAISKLENQIDAAESAATAAATVIASGSSADTTEHLEIATTTDPTTNAKTYTFDLKDVASQTDLAALSAKTVTEVASSNSSISATTAATSDGTVSVDLVTDASKVKMTGFTADASGFTAITTASTVTEAVKTIETEFLANEQTTSQALNDLKASKLENIVVNGVTGTVANQTATVTISGDDILLTGYQSGATGEVAATDDVDAAISKLNTKIASAVQGGVTGITADSGITVNSTNINNPVVGAKLTAAADLPTGIAENAIKFDSTNAPGMYIEYIDAGTY